MGKGLHGKRVAIGAPEKRKKSARSLKNRAELLSSGSPRHGLSSREAGRAGFADVCGGKS